MIINSTFSSLTPPWQACLRETWQAYCAGTVPIGAAIADATGAVIAGGRNHIFDDGAPQFQIGRHSLAHAEINALLSMRTGPEALPIDFHTCTLYTVVEPCPLCLGAIYMAGVRTIKYACRDPYAGSTNLLGTTPYLSEKPVQAYHEPGGNFETLVCAMQMEFSLRCHGGRSYLLDVYRPVLPQGVSLGEELFREGFYAAATGEPWSANAAFDWLETRILTESVSK